MDSVKKGREELNSPIIVQDRATKFWQMYKTVKGGLAVALRSGFGAYGIYDIDINNPFDYSRSESDLEHTCGYLYLVTLFWMFYPELITSKTKADFDLVGLFHEVGEIERGDCQDDGTRDEETKDREELAYLKEIIKNAPPRIRKKIINLFTQFQDKSTDFGKIAFFIDKLEAVLEGFVYESQGRAGSYKNKRKTIDKPSKNDQINMLLTGSDSIPDMWGCNIVLRARKYHFEHLPIFIEIMQSAALDVRGKKMDWIPVAMNYPFDPSYL